MMMVGNIVESGYPILRDYCDVRLKSPFVIAANPNSIKTRMALLLRLKDGGGRLAARLF